MSICNVGKGVCFEFVSTTAVTIAAGATFTYNLHQQNNTKIFIKRECRCEDEKEYFIENKLNTDRINLKLPGRYLFEVKVDTPTAAGTAVAITDNEGNVEKIPLVNGDSGAVSMYFHEKFSTVRLINVGTVPIVLTPGADTTVPLVILTISYLGL